MPGTALENGSAPVSPVSNGTPERRCESYSVHSPNGLRKGFLNGACSAPVVQDVLDLPEAKPVEHVPLFSQAAAPSHVTNSTTSITLRWKEISQIGLTHPLPEGTQQQTCVVEYAMEKQQVETRSTAEGAELAAICKADKWTEVYRGLELTAEVTDLKPGRRYAFRLLCFPTAHTPLTQPPSQPPSQPAAFATPARKPDTPAPPTLSARARNSLTFKWREPEDTGGRDIFQYLLQMKPPPGDQLDRALHEAANIMGQSDWSDEALFTTQAALPGSPEGLECTTDGPTSALVTWQTPADGGAPIFAYQLQRAEIESSDFQPVYRGEMSQCIVTGLCSGQGYKYRVLAQNEEGKGPWSSILETQTAAVPPDSPAVPTTMGSNCNSVSIRWTAPESDGGSAVTQYQVELRPKSKLALEGISNEWLAVHQGEAPACTMSCLTAGCVYQVRIRAQNSSGWGNYCLPTEVSSAPGVPHVPGVPKGTSRSPSSIDLEWAVPRHDGGSDIGFYRLEMSSGESTSGFKTVLQQPAIQGCHAAVQDLQPGAQYSFQVYAVNSEGASPASGIGHVRTQAAPPLPPDLLQASAVSPSSFKLSWHAPESQGAPVTDYSVRIQPSSALASGHVTDLPNGRPLQNGHADTLHTLSKASGHDMPHSNGDMPSNPQGRVIRVKGTQLSTTVTDLQPFTEYSCQVQAGNSAGKGDWSSKVSVRTAAAVTSAPVALEASDCTSSSISLQWQAPLRDNGSAVTSYHVEYASAGGPMRHQHTWHKGYDGTQRHCQLEGLWPGREYQLRVRAQSGQGQSPWSSTLHTHTTADVPGSPSQPVCSKRTSSGALVKWESPDHENGAPVTSYRLEYADEERGFRVAYQGAAPQYKLQGLPAGTSYHVRVCAVNAIGHGSWSEEASFSTTQLPPLPPTQLDCAVEADPVRPSLTVSWSSSTDSSNLHAQVASYELEILDQTEAAYSSSQRHTCPGKVQTFTVSSVQPGSCYQVRVRCVGSQGSGHGKYSEPVVVNAPGNRQTFSKPPSARNDASSAAGESTSSALVSSHSGKSRGKPESSLVSAEDFASVNVSRSKKKLPRGKRKGASAGARTVAVTMPAELFAIHFPKSLHKATNGRVPKRYVIGTIPPAVLPAYRAVRSAVFRFCRFVDRWKWLLLLALLIIYGLARVFKNGLPGADAPHPTVYREKMQKARWYGVNY